MEQNEGTCDRIARLVIPLVIIFLIIRQGGCAFTKLLLVICGISISTAISGYCPGYVPLGINTSCCKK